MPDHKKYVEPFVGGGSVFFAKEPAEKEVINDKDKGLVGFYRAFRKKGVSVKKCDMRPSKTKFDRLKKSKPKSDQSCVCKYIYLNKRSYAGGNSFNQKASMDGQDKRDKKLGTKSISEEHTKRLKKAKIESKDYKTVVKQNDSKNTFTYLDPPYPDTYDYDKPAVDPDEVLRLAKHAKGKVLISYNDHPKVRKAAKKYGLKVERVKTRYTMGSDMSDGGKVKTELLISNYDTKKAMKENKGKKNQNVQKQKGVKKRVKAHTFAIPSVLDIMGTVARRKKKKGVKKPKTAKPSSKSKKSKKRKKSRR